MPASTIPTELNGTNLELKARAADLDELRRRVRAVGAELEGTERQIDRYFPVAADGGHLKLRASTADGAHLIVYHRPEGDLFRSSDYHRLPVVEPESLARTLAALFGTGARVEKCREVWWWRGIRIHLDEVDGLGRFVELEARVDRIGDPQEAARRLHDLCARLGLTSEFVNDSYGELPCPTTK